MSKPTPYKRSRTARATAAILAAALATSAAHAQSTTYTLDDAGDWQPESAPEPGTPEARIAEARRLLLDGQPDRAIDTVNRWLNNEAQPDDPLRAEALLIRADAKVADGNEFKALYDYEELIREFPESEAFERAVERELEIGKQYLAGLDRKFLGLRIFDATDIGVELLIRVQERLPGSVLAEEAAIQLADFFYNDRQIELAGDAYGLYLENFPEGENAQRAARRQVYTAIARFRGPRYDASMLLDAQVRIQRYVERFPIDAERRGINQGLIDRLDESLAAQLLESADWYLDVDREASARLVLQRLIQTYPDTVAARQARQTLQQRGWPTTPQQTEAFAPPTPSPNNAETDQQSNPTPDTQTDDTP